MLSKIKRFFFFPVLKFRINYGFLKFWHWRLWRKITKERLKVFLLAFFVIFTIFNVASIKKSINKLSESFYSLKDDYGKIASEKKDDESLNQEEKLTEENKCNVQGIDVRGYLSTYVGEGSLDLYGNKIEDQTSSEDVFYIIERAEKDESIKAILLQIDSYGGEAMTGEEISNALKNSSKPTVALIRGAGTSAAYWSATGAEIIFASALSDVGGIGVTFSYVDNYQKNIKDGLNYNSLSIGKFKDYGDPDKPLSDEEKGLIMRDLQIIYDNFVKNVAINRNLDIEKVKKIADGSSMPGEIALKEKLIDRIGGLYEVKEYLKEKIGENPEICW
jgi:signal peptide peptidase SppA